jgi:leucyl/phenylalanyl-tRNA--protein transferase
VSDRGAHQRSLVPAAINMYRKGWFPMFDERRRVVEWVQPHERAVLPLDTTFHVHRTLRQRVRSGRFRVTCDRAFREVIRACARPAAGREQTWLCDEIIALFDALHDAGHAHSIEAWIGDELVGGLYGLAIGGAFCGESMFSRPEIGGTDASKVCLVHLVEHLRARGFTLLDAQLHSNHLEQFGLFVAPMSEYLELLRDAVARDVTWGEYEPARAGRRTSDT